MKKNILLLFFMIASCSQSPWNYDLGEGYSYLRSGGAMDVDTYPGDAITYKSLFDDPVIFPEIKSYNYNSNFIICKQSYNEKLSNDLLQSAFEYRFHEIYYSKNYKKYFGITNYIPSYRNDLVFYNRMKKLSKKKHRGFTKSVVDSILNSNPLFLKMKNQEKNYYIIEKSTDSVFGPLNLKEFKLLKEKKKIDLDFED